MKKILVYGSQEFGQVVKALVRKCKYEFIGFIDDFNTGEEIIGSYSEVCKSFLPQDFEIVIAIGYRNIKERWDIYQKVFLDGYNVPCLVHPQAVISDSCKIGQGSIIMAGAIVDVNVQLKELVVVWPGGVVNHDSVINANTFLSPNSTVCGFAEIGKDCFLGAGTIVVDHKKVPDGSFIKAGSLFKG